MSAPEERPIPLWQKALACAYVLAAAGLLLAFHDRLGADFWPPDASRIAPNILATVIQVIIWAPVAVLLWPPFRRRLHRFVDRKVAPLSADLEEAHRKLDHVIRHHPAIPPLPPKD